MIITFCTKREEKIFKATVMYAEARIRFLLPSLFTHLEDIMNLYTLYFLPLHSLFYLNYCQVSSLCMYAKQV